MQTVKIDVAPAQPKSLLVSMLSYPIGFFVVGVLAASWTQGFLSVPPATLFPLVVVALVAISGLIAARRLRGLVCEATEEGVSLSKSDQLVFQLLWNDFGGYRERPASWFDTVLRPERLGIEILDARGATVGILPVLRTRELSFLATSPQRERLRARFFRHLNAHVPGGAPRYVKPEPRFLTRGQLKARMWVGLVAITLGGVLALKATELLSSPDSPRALMIAVTVASPISLGLGVYFILFAMGQSKPAKLSRALHNSNL